MNLVFLTSRLALARQGKLVIGSLNELGKSQLNDDDERN
jgi:hypothetical protein